MDIRFNPNHFQVVELPGVRDIPPRTVGRQACWQQLDQDRWLYAELERDNNQFRPRVYIREAYIRTGQRIDGSWRTARPIAGHTIGLVEDRAAPPSSAPVAPTAPQSPVAAEYIANRYSGPPAPIVDMAEVRRRLGQH